MKQSTVINGLHIVWRSLFLKDPCKKCIVKACCTEQCDEKTELLHFIFPHNSINQTKTLAWITLFNMCILLIICMIVIAEHYYGPVAQW